MTPEGKVKAAVKTALQSEDAWFYMPVQNGMGRTGIPDFIACRPVEVTAAMVGKTIGVFVAVETKAPGKIRNTTPGQRRELQGIAAAHGVALVTDGPELVVEALKKLDRDATPVAFIPVPAPKGGSA